MKEVRIGVLGTGNIGRIHIDRLQKLQGVTVAAAADVSEASVEAAAADFGIDKVFTDYRELLKLDGLDAVMVCTPNAFHHEMVLDSLRAGHNVFCEKPMAMNAVQAEEMAAEAKRAGRMLYMGFCNRFRGKSRALKAFVAAGRSSISACICSISICG